MQRLAHGNSPVAAPVVSAHQNGGGAVRQEREEVVG